MKRGFTLVELLLVMGLISLFGLLMVPSVQRGREAARGAACASNLRQMHAAYLLYLNDHEGRFFPWRQNTEQGTLWYWGLETGGVGEGARGLDRSKALLAPYMGVHTVETCPSFPYGSTAFKRKYETASYGYGINIYLIADSLEARRTGVSTWTGLTRPDQMLVWGDAAQINMFQAPASPSNPMLEEWYYLASRPNELPTYHFRHQGYVQLIFGDGHVRSMPPNRLLPYVDGRVGYLESGNASSFLTASR